jgi:hypothetical protein
MPPCLALWTPTARAQVNPTALSQQGALYQPRMIGSAEVQADIALMRRALEVIHPGLYRRASEVQMAHAFRRLDATLRNETSELDLYREVSRLLARIRCSHTKAEQPTRYEAWRLDNPSHLPFRFKIVEGRMIVVSSDPGQAGLARGAEVLSINGRSVRRLIRELGGFVPVDGDTTWSRAVELANDGDLMGADFDHFYPYVYGQPIDFALTVRASDSESPRSITMRPLTFRSWIQLDNDGVGRRQNFSDTTTWRMMDAETGYLRVATFVNYREPVDAQALFSRCMAEFRAAGARRIIVDLRDNGGGSDDAALALLDHLALRPYTYQRAIRLKAIRYGDLADHIETWGDRDALFSPPLDNFTRTPGGWFERRPSDHPETLQPRTPAPAAFTGPVTVLTSPVNVSGATMLISKLRDERRVRLVGGRSGGSGDGPTAGQIFNLRLPNSGIVVRIPLALNVMNVSHFEPRGGITPDLLVEQSVENYRLGRDLVLETALATWRD